jgi:hypothetical protein
VYFDGYDGIKRPPPFLILDVPPAVNPPFLLVISVFHGQVVCLWLYKLLLDLGHFFSFLIFYTVGRTPWMGDQPVARPLPAHTHRTQAQNKCTQTTMPPVGFESMTPAFERAKAVHILDLAAIMIGTSK